MRTAVDTNVLLDIFLPDPDFGPASKQALQKQFSEGALLICEIVYSELAAFFPSRRLLEESLETLGVQYVPGGRDVCYLTGETWGKYRKGGGSRRRVLADFFIGAHAQIHADLLLTRDRGIYRKYFPRVPLIEP